MIVCLQEAVHLNSRAVIHWHLDEDFIGSTKDIHKMTLAPEPGMHTLTLVDENGEILERNFIVLDKGHPFSYTIKSIN